MKDCLALLPARVPPPGGPGWNADLAGAPLLAHSVAAAREAGLRRILVTAPDEATADCARALGAEPVMVPPVAESSVEEIVRAALARLDVGGVDCLAVLPPERPLRRPGRVAAAWAALRREGADSLFACHRERPLFWRRSPGGLIPFYDPERRPARAAVEEGEFWLRENGSIYICRVAELLAHRGLVSGRVATLEVDRVEGVSVHSRHGLEVCRALAGRLRPGGAGIESAPGEAGEA